MVPVDLEIIDVEEAAKDVEGATVCQANWHWNEILVCAAGVPCWRVMLVRS